MPNRGSVVLLCKCERAPFVSCLPSTLGLPTFHSYFFMHLRKATPGDVQPIAALHAASWQSTYARVLQPRYLSETAPSERKALWQQRLSQPTPHQHVFVAEASGHIVGFVCAFMDEHPAWGSYLENLHVATHAQGRGIGRQLMHQAAAVCAQHATSTALYLSVNQDNVQAQRFYASLGARNAATAVWHAPDGSAVPTYRFEWSSVTDLAQRSGSSGLLQ